MLLYDRIDAFIEREEILLSLSNYQQYKNEFTIFLGTTHIKLRPI